MSHAPFIPPKTRVKQRAERFYTNVDSLDLKKDLVAQARTILSYIHRELTPVEKARIANKLLKEFPRLDPTVVIDTYGLEQTIALLAADTKDAVAGRRLYRSMIDSYMKYKGGHISLMEIILEDQKLSTVENLNLSTLLFEYKDYEHFSTKEVREEITKAYDFLHRLADVVSDNIVGSQHDFEYTENSKSIRDNRGDYSSSFHSLSKGLTLVFLFQNRDKSKLLSGNLRVSLSRKLKIQKLTKKKIIQITINMKLTETDMEINRNFLVKEDEQDRVTDNSDKIIDEMLEALKIKQEIMASDKSKNTPEDISSFI